MKKKLWFVIFVFSLLTFLIEAVMFTFSKEHKEITL